jgi:mRNA interferase MazF
MANSNRGDVCLVDLGMAAKVRPCVVVSIRKADSMRNMSVVVPLTKQIRGGETEIGFPKPPWLTDDSVANLIGIAGVDNHDVGRFLGRMPAQAMEEISDGLARMLGL